MNLFITKSNHYSRWLQAFAFTQILLLAACGGSSSSSSDDDDPPPPTPGTFLSGTAAAGAPIIGTVTVKGSMGISKSALIEADGSYDVDVTGLTPPYRLRAVGTVGGRTYKLHSYAEMADVGGNVNITPFTDLIVANAAGQIAEAYFDSNTPVELSPAEIEEQEAALQAKLQSVFNVLGVSSTIDLLNSTFSADHSGLDAALDIVRIEVDPALQQATITNLLENTSINDSLLDQEDNTTVLPVNDAAVLADGVTDIQAIAAWFDDFAAAFANGLPTAASIEDYFSADFYEEDTPIGPWLTDITTDPSIIGLTVSSVSVSDLNSDAGTAMVIFNVSINGIVDVEPITWLFARDATLGWQARGDQRIVDTYFSFHCNDNDGNGSGTGGCGVNTQFWDEDFTNNGTMNAPIASGTVSIINSGDMMVKDVIYLGTPGFAAPGDVQVYNEGSGQFQGDYKGFGNGVGDISSAIFTVGDIIQYDLYTQELDISTQASPQVATGTEVATYTETLLFAPSLVGLYPDATAATLTAIDEFELGDNLTIAWTLAAGTRNSEVLVQLSDSMGNRIENWVDTFGDPATSVTVVSSSLDSTAATNAGLDADAVSYNLLVRIYAEDEITGQAHSRDYNASIPGPATPPQGTLACNYESGWDDTADGGLGAPIIANSFADYEGALADCGTAQSFTVADVAGKSFNDGDGEVMTFDALGGTLGTEADRGTGSSDDGVDVIAFNWYVEAATCSGCTHDYIVVYSDSTIEPGLPAGLSIRETSALTHVAGTLGVAGAVYTTHKYSEQSNYSDMDRATGSDGEIWISVDTLQNTPQVGGFYLSGHDL